MHVQVLKKAASDAEQTIGDADGYADFKNPFVLVLPGVEFLPFLLFHKYHSTIKEEKIYPAEKNN